MKYNPILPPGQSIIHILVIWHSAMEKKTKIINDLNSNFQILKVFRGHWDKDKYLDNFLIFYAHSQKHRTYDVYRYILLRKIQMCGTGDFEVIIFKDYNPQFETRQTSSGVRYVNTRVFDKKKLYREWTGGGHLVHGSDDAWETNKDLTIMFGMNTDDFCKHYESEWELVKENNNEITEDRFYRNCLGVGGYKNIQELFYVLNNTIDYVVMRNHEPIPDEYRVEGHGDIDLLVENRNYAVYLTGATPVYPQPYRVYHTIKIGNTIIPFDFRSIYDNYYDIMWQADILYTRILTKKMFYVPNPENQYFSLLYHAYIQKKIVKDDYHPKLTAYGNAIGIEYIPQIESVMHSLDSFMEKHNYEYIRPKDITVVYNRDSLAVSKYANRFGDCIKRNHILGHDIDYDSIVYKTPDAYIKRGTGWLIDNEYFFLKKLANYNYFPKILSYEKITENESIVKISAMPGITPMDFFAKPYNNKRKNIVGYITGALNIISVLSKEGVLHRDLYHDNFLINIDGNNVNVSLIDFGWATTYDKKDAPISSFVCKQYVNINNKYDLIEFSNVIKKTWGLSPVCRFLSKELKEIWNNSDNHATISVKIEQLSNKINKKYSLLDSFAFTYYSIIQWDFLYRVVRNRTFQGFRNRKGIVGILCNIAEYLRIKFL